MAELKRRASSTDTLSPPPTALSPELSDQGPESKSRQINAAREWLANTEGMVTAADEPPASNLGVDDAAGGGKAAAPPSPANVVRMRANSEDASSCFHIAFDIGDDESAIRAVNK